MGKRDMMLVSFPFWKWTFPRGVSGNSCDYGADKERITAGIRVGQCLFLGMRLALSQDVYSLLSDKKKKKKKQQNVLSSFGRLTPKVKMSVD